MGCPKCGSGRDQWKSGILPSGYQRYQCPDCGRFWNESPHKAGRKPGTKVRLRPPGEACTRCGSTQTQRYGFAPSGKQKWRCTECGYAFTEGRLRNK